MQTYISINGKAGNIEACLHLPSTKNITGLGLVLHPHPLFGGTMDNKIVQTLVKALNELGYIAIRFNFRGVGKSAGVHDNGINETIDALDVLNYLKQDIVQDLVSQGYSINTQKIVIGGFSFGSFVASNILEYIELPSKMLMIGTAAGKWDVKKVPENSLIVHGEDDDVILLDWAMQWAKKYELPITVVPKAGHFFHGKLVLLKNLVKQSLMLD